MPEHITNTRAPNTRRKPITKTVRFEVFKRDGFTCSYCGAHPPAVVLHVDHIHPVAKGGDNSIDNLVTACETCNQGKSARLLSNDAEDAMRYFCGINWRVIKNDGRYSG